MKEVNSFSNLFKKYRKTSRYTLDQLAEISGISKHTLFKIETQNAKPSLDTLMILSHYLKCDLVGLYKESNNPVLYEINRLVADIETDLSARNYRNLNGFQQRLDKLYECFKFDPTDSQLVTLFNRLDQVNVWLEALICSENFNYLESAELIESFYELNELESVEGFFQKHSNTLLEINLLMTMSSAKMMAREFEYSKCLQKLMEKYLESEVFFDNRNHFLTLYFRTLYNLVSILIVEEEYELAIIKSQEALHLLRDFRLSGETYSFYLTMGVAEFKLGSDAYEKSIDKALMLMEIEHKEYLYSNIIEGIASYDIDVSKYRHLLELV